MTPVDQTAFEEKGNCLAACIATIFGIAIDELPDFLSGNWKKKLQEWANGIGYSAEFVAVPGFLNFALEFRAPMIVCGRSPRGRMHAMVWCNGRRFHDPHPSRAGLESYGYGIVFVPLRHKVLS